MSTAITAATAPKSKKRKVDVTVPSTEGKVLPPTAVVQPILKLGDIMTKNKKSNQTTIDYIRSRIQLSMTAFPGQSVRVTLNEIHAAPIEFMDDRFKHFHASEYTLCDAVRAFCKEENLSMKIEEIFTYYDSTGNISIDELPNGNDSDDEEERIKFAKEMTRSSRAHALVFDAL